jgi:hypothetical protein
MTIRQIFSCFAFVALLGLSACDTARQSWSDITGQTGPASPVSTTQIQDEDIKFNNRTASTSSYGMNETDMARQFSNENVIVYPVNGNPYDAQPRTFPEYRSVLDNTIGGYTVFDPSVTVFGLNGEGVMPDYMPAYSVPTYTQPSNQGQLMPLPEPRQVPSVNYVSPYNNGQMGLSPRVPSGPTNLTAPAPTRPMPNRDAQRRSRPVLTGY